MEFGSKKYLILLTLICIVFAIIIIKAFDYLPDKSVDGYNSGINSQPQYPNQFNANNQNQNISQNQTEDNYDPERHKSGHIDFMPKESKTENNNNGFDEISAPNGVNEDVYNPNTQNNQTLTPDDLAVISLVKAAKLQAQSDYKNALEELQKIPELTNNQEILASSYEKIAEIYAHQRRYGTALSFAGKAYSTSPNVNREVLIARIYYQSGDTENAVTRMNNIINRGFKN